MWILTAKGEQLAGIICKGVGGFYYVQTEQGVFAGKARGLFRKQGVRPLAGDRVLISVTHEGDREAYLEQLLERRNSFVRPPIANLDRLFIVVAAANPPPSTLMIDKLIAICEHKGIEPLLVINKSDLAAVEALRNIYAAIGYCVLVTSAAERHGIEAVAREISGKLCAFAGHSGVGKSSILNQLLPLPIAEVGGLSERLGRGKHTTRHVELFSCSGGWIADTPGFGDISFEQFEPILKDELAQCFVEFAPHFGSCRFSGCYHDREPDCAVKQAVEKGEIARSRHESYLAMLQDVKDLKEWES